MDQPPVAKLADTRHPCRSPNLRRWTLVGLGLFCVGLGALGVIVPGLPTTIFLIAASWCFTRSCPWLEDRLIRNRFFGPYLRFLDGDTPMPPRVMWSSLALMWTAISISTWALLRYDASVALTAGIPFAGIIGSVVLVRVARRAPRPASPSVGVCPVASSLRAGSIDN